MMKDGNPRGKLQELDEVHVALQRHRTNEVLVRTDQMVPWITGGLLARLKYDNAIKDERVN